MTSIHVGMSFAEYKRENALNWSLLKHMAKSPAHYAHAICGSESISDAFLLGRATHVLALEPHQFEGQFAVWRTRKAGREFDEFDARSALAGREVLSLKQFEAAKSMAESVRRNKAASGLLSEGNAEASVLFDVGSRRAKARLDYYRPGSIVDLKTTANASPDSFARDCWKFGYLGQAAWYCDAVERVTGSAPTFHFIAVEKSPPWVCSVFSLSDELIQVGREHYQGLIERLDACERSGKWPGYVDGVAELELPKWARESDDEDVSDVGLVFKEHDENGF